MNDKKTRFVILGGGTAGWMAACLLARAWPHELVDVTLVESPDIGIIGVGEGSTPQMRGFFDQLGLAESNWMAQCNATYKVGIGFKGWSDRAGYGQYFHPFYSQLDNLHSPAFFYHCLARRTGRNVPAHPDDFYLAAQLAKQNRNPIAPENFPFAPAYGYHFDAHKVGAVLGEFAQDDLGVQHVEAHIDHVTRHENGDISALVTDKGEAITGDYFIDASGFGGFLIGKTLDERFISFGNNLYNDSAVVMPTPHDNPDAPFAPATQSFALSAGWAWAIPLTNRIGHGYVYSSAHISTDQAEAELRDHLAKNFGANIKETEARHLKMRVGRRENSWVKNVLAIGLAQGFLEPLEATALHITQSTIEGFIRALKTEQNIERSMPIADNARDEFNHNIASRYEGIRDYIVAHYKLNQRTDAESMDYWRSLSQNHDLSDSLKAILTCWYRGQDMVSHLRDNRLELYYNSDSWHCLFAGYGIFPDDSKLQPPGDDITRHDLDQIKETLRRCALNFAAHMPHINSR